jgi:glucose-6-phosphate isomerase
MTEPNLNAPTLQSETLPPQFLPLAQHAIQASKWQLRELFADDANRFNKFSLDAAGLFFDFSKNHINDETLALLTELARARGVESLRDAMFSGEHINVTEDRAVLHTALRAPAGASIKLDGQEVSADIEAVLQQISKFSHQIRSGSWHGYTGKSITDIVNIGIGGSDLGPAMTCAAMRPFSQDGLRLHFLSNVDGHEIDAILSGLSAATTLFIIASKTFTTQETMLNAHAARRWFLQYGQTQDLAKHFVAVSTNTAAVKEFGIDITNMFPFWDWVGGRYSIWSAIGLPLAIAVGIDNFREFLAGGHAMDTHFRNAPLEKNMPVLLALTGFWYRQFFGSASHLIAPYHHDLQLLPSYLQQLEMESNGKRTTRDGQPLTIPSAPVIWGSAGSNGQHAYFQLLHQGTDLIPVDFIAVLKAAHPYPDQHKALLANCFAQSEALMRGKNEAEVKTELQEKKLNAQQIDALLPHRVFPGNKPSNTLLLEKLTPFSIGTLIALYEHKVFVQGVLWNINSFDQWGVELGKVLAGRILSELDTNSVPGVSENHDSSTTGLIARARIAM